ncbi:MULTISPECIES: dephospho-CoA kinase [unclassified Exiguobacterium]|uniref:dephospho-CoA kinase n=1 Tax=unclassified Exiguobacterium TaxID=2644629 RepID=UPI000B587418|nr:MULTISPECIES: dephospho-CoA kinase [unclassified Exiguobacterium]ASI36046.1 dephospho-CoA kinase [Exiguobacterium sp. N4-1P]
MRIGLTGGIATGKSTVATYLQTNGIPVIDADLIAREVMEPDGLAYQDVKAAFPEAFEDGILIRAKLGEIIFHDSEKRNLLNELMHPKIRQQMLARADELEQQEESLVVFDIPLLLEGDWKQLVDQVVVVYCNAYLQLDRLMERNQMSREEAQSRVQSQLDIEQKRLLADYVLVNEGTVEALYRQIDQWLKTLPVTR